MGVFSIRDIENFTGLKAHTLRVWEQRYDLLTPKRTDTNIRYYDNEDLRKLLNIAVLNQHGIKISRIAEMSDTEIQEAVMNITRAQSDDSNLMRALISAMLQLDEPTFDKIMSASLLHHGLTHTMNHIIFPFLNRVGMLWSAGSIHVAHEHFITNLIRQKIIVAIDQLVPVRNPNAKKFVLFLQKNEMHELGLLFAQFLLRSKGHQVIYLGQNLPIEELEQLLVFYKPGAALTAFTTAIGQKEVTTLVETLHKQVPEMNIILAGGQLNKADFSFNTYVKIVSDIPAFQQWIDNGCGNGESV